jgi:hypothetical protein
MKSGGRREKIPLRLRGWPTPPILLPIFFGLMIVAVRLHRHQF